MAFGFLHSNLVSSPWVTLFLWDDLCTWEKEHNEVLKCWVPMTSQASNLSFPIYSLGTISLTSLSLHVLCFRTAHRVKLDSP